MFRKFKAVTAVIAILAMLSGCVSDKKTPQESTDPNGPITFDWYVNESWFNVKWGQDSTSKYITEKTGVSLNLITPAGNANEKLTTMIASRDFPDFISLGQWEESYIQLRDGGFALPLNKLADQYDTTFYDNTYKSTLDWYTHTDGNVYGYPNCNMPLEAKDEMEMDSLQTFLVRKDIYEALGEPNMRTPEGFLDALQRAKEMFPTENGQPLIPLMSYPFDNDGCDGFEGYLANFLAIPQEKDGVYLESLRLRDPEYIRWLKTLRKANEMGLISKDIFIDQTTQLNEKVAQGRYFAILITRNGLSVSLPSLYENSPEKTYIAVDGPANSQMDDPVLTPSGISGWHVSLITVKNKNPERAIKFMSYWLSEEGQKDFFMGDPAVTREVVDGVEKIKDDVYELRDTDETEFIKKYGCRDTIFMLLDNIKTAQWTRPLEEPFKQMRDWTLGKVVSKPEVDNVNPPADSPEGLALAKRGEKWGVLLPKLILAKSDEEFDTLITAFWAEEDELHKIYLPYVQARYAEGKRKLGFE